MKKALLLTLMTLLAVSVSLAQFGIKGGINIGTFGGADKALDPGAFDPSLSGLPKLEPTARVGFTAGVLYKVGLIAGLSIQPEVLYTQKGAVYETTIPGIGTAKGTFKVDYIDVPVFVKFSLPIPLVSPYVEAGVSYSFLMSAKLKGESPAGSQEMDIKDGTTKNDLSFRLGVGVELLILDINAQYVIGNTKLYKDIDWKIYNRGIVLTVGIKF